MDIGQGESAAYRLLNQGIEEGAILGAGKLSDKGGFLVRGEGGHCSLQQTSQSQRFPDFLRGGAFSPHFIQSSGISA